MIVSTRHGKKLRQGKEIGVSVDDFIVGLSDIQIRVAGVCYLVDGNLHQARLNPPEGAIIKPFIYRVMASMSS